MIDFFIDGQPVQAHPGQTVMQAAVAAGVDIPSFCWHPQLSVPGNCRICMVEVEAEGGAWFDISCNMPVTKDMRVLTDSEKVKELRRDVMQFITLNHPVDCGICNKSGECLLQDHHFAHNGMPSLSRDPKTHATKFYPLSSRIMLDNERCIMCSRCVRFTAEISKSDALGVQHRGDHSLIRPAADVNFDDDAYSDNVIDICPVGALLSRDLLDHARIWYLKATPSVCPGCERGCSINIWHRKSEWALRNLDQRLNSRIDRVTPLENPAVNGPWICNKARDLARIFERPRVLGPMLNGAASTLDVALRTAAGWLREARKPIALVSSWGSNEELAAFHVALGPGMTSFVKADHLPQPGERIEDDLLIKPDKNPNMAGATAMFARLPDDPSTVLAEADFVLVWGEGAPMGDIPASAKVVMLSSYELPQNARGDVLIPISIQTERAGHYTNFAGTVTPFQPCFARPVTVVDAATVFERLYAAMSDGAGAQAALAETRAIGPVRV